MNEAKMPMPQGKEKTRKAKAAKTDANPRTELDVAGKSIRLMNQFDQPDKTALRRRADPETVAGAILPISKRRRSLDQRQL